MQDDTFDIITIKNPSTDPFEVVYDNKSYGFLMPGQFKRFPRFLAKLAVKHLIDHCLNKEGLQTNNQAGRDRWSAEIVMEEEITALPTSTPQEKLQADVDRMNQGSDLDRIMKKRAEAPATPQVFTPQAPIIPAPVDPVPSRPVAEAIPLPSPALASMGISTPTGAGMTLPEVDMTEDVPVAPVPTPVPASVDPARMPQVPAPIPMGNPAQPTRDQLYKYASETLAMDLSDSKTRAALDAQSEAQLVETLSYELGA